MRRPAKFSAPRTLRRHVSIARLRLGSPATPTLVVPVLARVRASLVLRLVKKGNGRASLSDDHGGR